MSKNKIHCFCSKL